MDNKKNIDRLFQEKFKDFEAVPNDAVWNRINQSLPTNKKKKRRVIALWWQIGGVAAVITLLLTVGVTVFNSSNDNQEFPIVNTDKKEGNQKGNKSNKEQNKLNSIEDNTTKVANSGSENKFNLKEEGNHNTKKTHPSNQLTTSNKFEQNLNAVTNNSNKKEKIAPYKKRNNLTTVNNKDNNTKIAINTKSSSSSLKSPNTTQLATDTEIKSTIKKTIKNNKIAVARNTSPNKSETSNAETKNTEESTNENTIIEKQKKQSIEEAIAEKTNIINEKEDDKQNRWSIAPNVAPVYYSSLGQGSSLDKQFNENSKSSDINMSYGISGSYAISKKLKIRTGVNRVNLNQRTSDVFAFTAAETAARGLDAQFRNIRFKDGLQTVSLMSSKMLNRTSTPEVFNAKIAGNIDQKFGFIEVPLELEYRLLDKKFGINVIGGFSTFFLNQNEIYADIDGRSTLIGESDNLNSTSFSANFGLGIDYSLSKQWNINLEPTFKYQINTFNNTSGNFRPFFIGVYTGLSFKF